MKQRWKLVVEEFGKIEKAEIEVAPFMLFVGENNSGKSYLMSLIWGIMSLGKKFITPKGMEYESFLKCKEWLEPRLLKNKNNKIIIDKTGEQLFIDWFNQCLKEHKENLVHTVLNHKTTIGKLKIEEFSRVDRLRIVFIWGDDESTEQRVSRVNTYSYSKNQVYIKMHGQKNKISVEDIFLIMRFTVWMLVMADLQSPGALFNSRYESLYLPASRTGFMMTYKSVVSDILSDNLIDMDSDNKPTTTLPYSVVQFLRKLVGLELEPKALLNDVAAYIEDEVMHGKLKKVDNPIPNYEYVPEGNEEALPLHSVSSLVTELSPLVLFLRSNYNFGLLIMEEPEAHLHPTMQALLVKALVRLVNTGLPIWITTHSDTMIQQVNNLITLASLRDKVDDPISLKEFGYVRSDLISWKKVRMYEFTLNSYGKTIVRPLESTPEGFVVQTFNDAIINLSREAISIQNELAISIE